MPVCYGRDDMFETGDNFSWDEEKYAAECLTRWGVTPRLRTAELMYGGREVRRVANIVYSGLGLEAEDDTDPPSVVEERNREKEHIRKWVGGFNTEADSTSSLNYLLHYYTNYLQNT